MKLKIYFFVCCYFIFFNNNASVFATANIFQEKSLRSKSFEKSISNISSNKIKKALIKVHDIFTEHYSKKRTVKLFDKKNDDAKVTSRNFLLKVGIPLGVIVGIFYLLYHYYKTTSLSLGPDFNSWTFLFTDFKQILRSFGFKILESIFAILRLSALGRKTDTIFGDGLRIASSFLFLVNKNQFSTEGFKQGAYYSAGWGVYDIFHMIKTFYDNAKSEQDADFAQEEQEVQFERIGRMLCLYILPIAESATSLFLALNTDETPDAIKARKNVQAIYSFVRFLPVYLRANRDVVDILFVVNLLVAFLDFWHSSDLASNADNFEKVLPEEILVEIDKEVAEEIPEEIPKEIINNEHVDDEKADDEKTKPVKKVAEENLEKDLNKTYHPKSMVCETGSRSPIPVRPQISASANCELIRVLTSRIDNLVQRYPYLESLVSKVNHLDLPEDIANREPIDNRSLRVILEEKLKRAEKLIKELE